MPARIDLPEDEIVQEWLNTSATSRSLGDKYGCSYVKIQSVLSKHLTKDQIDRGKRAKLSASTANRPDLKTETHRNHCKVASASVRPENRRKCVMAAIQASSASRKGKPLCSAHKEKISKALTGKYGGDKSPSWRNGTSKKCSRGIGWKKARRQCLERDQYQCQICKVEQKSYYRALDVHHRISYFEFDNVAEANALSNLIALCHSCHMKVENGSIECP